MSGAGRRNRNLWKKNGKFSGTVKCGGAKWNITIWNIREGVPGPAFETPAERNNFYNFLFRQVSENRGGRVY